MASVAQLQSGLAEYLAKQWNAPVTVENVNITTAGARRQNVLFDAIRDGERLGLVATINPSEAMQIIGVDVEAGTILRAEALGVPVAHVHFICLDPSYVGGAFFITTLVEGETVGRQVLRLVEQEGIGDLLAYQCGQALARLHAGGVEGAHELLERPTEGRTASEQVLANIEETMTEDLMQPSPVFTMAYRWLERNQPRPGKLTVVHRDFRNGNIIVGPDGLRASLDWEVCRISDPMEDPPYVCQRMWRFRNDELEVGGFAQRAPLREGYIAAGGAWDEDSFFWWKVLATLRWGLGLSGQARQHLDGSVPSIVMAASGRRIAEQEYDLLMLLRKRFA